MGRKPNHPHRIEYQNPVRVKQIRRIAREVSSIPQLARVLGYSGNPGSSTRQMFRRVLGDRRYNSLIQS